MLTSVQIEHEIDQRALELRALAEVDGKACAGDFGGAFKVEDAEIRADVPMGLGVEVEPAGLTPFLDFDVRGLILASRDALVREVGNRGEVLAELVFEQIGLLAEGGDAIADGADLRLQLLGILARFLQFADFHALGRCAGH